MSGPALPEGLWARRDDEGSLRPLYDGWAERYDADMQAAGTVGPARVAAMLERVLPDRAAPVVDFGCGTGAAGAALRHLGYEDVVGVDLSAAMLARARARGVYREVRQNEPDAPVAVPHGVRGVVASGSISIGAAPAGLLGRVLHAMAPGALLVLTYNDDTLRDAAYMGALADSQVGGFARLEAAEYGPQLPALGRGAAVYALRRL